MDAIYADLGSIVAPTTRLLSCMADDSSLPPPRYAHGAICAALVARGSTGRGQHVECDLLRTQVATLANLGANYLLAGRDASRQGTAHPSIVPYQAFEAKGGDWFVCGALNDGQVSKEGGV